MTGVGKKVLKIVGFPVNEREQWFANGMRVYILTYCEE